MRRLPIPTLDDKEVYDACSSKWSELSIAQTYAAAALAMQGEAVRYRDNASQHSLYRLPFSAYGNNYQVVIGGLTKGNLKRLYDVGMFTVPSARKYYDQLLSSAPLSVCPYCQLGHVATLDHFLPKAFYPSYSVLPANLIPACRDCNSGKSGRILIAAEEMSHPYFEEPEIEFDPWLMAEIVKSNPVTAKYSVNIPSQWSPGLSRRVINYFSQLKLSTRFSIQAASELVSVSSNLRLMPSSNARCDHLRRSAAVERGRATNGWKAALYTALAASQWYCEEGYALKGAISSRGDHSYGC